MPALQGALPSLQGGYPLDGWVQHIFHLQHIAEDDLDHLPEVGAVEVKRDIAGGGVILRTKGPMPDSMEPFGVRAAVPDPSSSTRSPTG